MYTVQLVEEQFYVFVNNIDIYNRKVKSNLKAEKNTISLMISEFQRVNFPDFNLNLYYEDPLKKT